MSRFDTHQSSKLTFAEGAAAATPASGLVHLYAKADGLLYSKDDAGTESAVSGAGAGGDVATDTIWDAAGDLAVGTGADTAGRLAKGADGGVLAMGNGAVIWNAGTSFPASKATNDRYWRTDLGLEFYWDGTRWLSTQILSLSFPPTTAFTNFTATANIGRLPVPFLGVFGIWGVRFDWFMIPGTAHDNTNYYTCKINSADQADSDTQFGAVTLDSKTATTTGNNFTFTGAINAVLGGTARELKLRIDKVSSAPNLTYSSGSIHFRLIATT